MALFPFFINLENVQGYVIGSGEHAQEKIEKLKPYHPKLKLISEDDFRAVCLEEKPFYVIVAGKNSEINHQIANFCREKNILVNVVDDPVYCDFLFPSLITHGNLSIGICTGGASPTAGMLIKKQVERNGKFAVIYTYKDSEGNKRQKWETYPTKADAKKRQKEIEYRQELGGFTVPKCKTVKDLMREYVPLYGKEHWALSHYAKNMSLINNYINPLIGDTKLNDINTRFLEKLYQSIR